MANTPDRPVKRGLFERFIHGIEIVGNKLPHPFWLFVILSLIVIALSYYLAQSGTAVKYLAASKKAGEAPKEVTVAVLNLLSFKAMRAFFADFVKTYVSFAPLGLIMTMTLGIGLVEQTGLISALMRRTILGAPSFLVTATLAFVGINANLASDAGIIFTPVIGAAVFKALGRNPWVGIIVGYAAASGGFTANLFVAGTDALLAGITQSAAKGMSVSGPTHPLINWYFMLAATVLLTFLTTWVTEKFTVKVLGDEGTVDESFIQQHAVTPEERRGLRMAGIALILCVGLLLYLTVPQGSFFRSDNGTLVPTSPLLSSIVGVLFSLFFVIGIAYGLGAGTIKTASDVPKLMQKGMSGAVSFLVVALPAAFFVQLFNMSNLTTILSVKGAEALEAMHLGGIPLLVCFILLCSFINLFMISGSAKWLILAPIFVPMFSLVGFSPALTQVAYRIGDSSTNIISPLSYYVPVVIGLLEQYKKESDPPVGIGTVISLSMPYSMAFLVGFTLLLIVFYMFGIPLGPGAAPGI